MTDADVTPGEDAQVPSDGAVAFGQFRIQELIGAGGMAEVYRATSVGPGGFHKPVVIKRVKPKHAKDPAFVRMFVDEAKLSARLQHPNIVTVFEFGAIEEHHYIAMEYIDGLHLQAAHVRHLQVHQAPLPWRACVILVRDLLLGLDYAHDKEDEHGEPLGLVHRDINLVNVMLSRAGAVKILDFGIVKAADGIRSAETVGGVLKGKFGYMSPEQAEGKVLDRRSDVFSTAIVLHELLTGRRLFWGEDDLAILRKVRSGEIPDPRVYRLEIPEAVVEITLKGLARDRDARYGSAGEMAEALDHVIAAERIPEATLRLLMEELLPPQPAEASESMRRRRRKMTLMAWAAGVKDAEPPNRKASGVLSVRDAQATAVGKRTGAMAPVSSPEVDEALITSTPRWLAPEGAPEDGAASLVLGEQDTTVVTAARVGDGTVDEVTVLLVSEDGGTEALSEAERALFPAAGRRSSDALALSSEETRLLGGDEPARRLLDAGETAAAPGPAAASSPPSRALAADPEAGDAQRTRAPEAHRPGRARLAWILVVAILAGAAATALVLTLTNR